MSCVQKKYILIILILFVLISGLLLNSNLPMGGGDDSHYLVLAKSLSSQQDYKNVFHPDSPVEIEHPFFYPFLLSLVLLLFPKTVIGLKSISILFGAASLVVIYILFFDKHQNTSSSLSNGRLGPIACNSQVGTWLFLLLICSNLWFLTFSVSIRPEILYLFLSIATLLFIEKYKTQKNCINMYLFGGVLAAQLLFFTKTIGFSIMLGMFVYFVVNKEYKKGVVFISIWVILICPWIIWVEKNRPLVEGIALEGYLQEIIWVYQLNIVKMVKGILWNMFCYWQAVSQLLLSGYFLKYGQTIFLSVESYLPFLYSFLYRSEHLHSNFSLFLTFMITIFLSGTSLLGFLYCLIKRKRMIDFYVLFYLIILAVFPCCDYSKIRYLVPLFPFMLYYFLAAPFWPKASNLFFKGIILILLIYNLVPIGKLIKTNLCYAVNYIHLSEIERKDYYPTWFFRYFTATEWIKENTSKDAVIMEHNPAAFYLFSNRKTVWFDQEPFWLYKRSFTKIKTTIETKNVDYVVTIEENQKKIIQYLNTQCEDVIFHPLVEFKSKYADCLVKIYQVAKIKPEVKLLNKRGEYFYSRGDYDRATDQFRDALKYGPHFVICYNLGQSYEKKGMKAEALKMYEESIKLQPDYQVAKNRFNIIRQREVVDKKPYNALTWEKLGECLLINYEYKEAIAAFKKALYLDSSLAKAYYNLGLSYINEDKYIEAISEFQKALKLEPKLKHKIRHYIKIAKKKEKEMITYSLTFKVEKL